MTAGRLRQESAAFVKIRDELQAAAERAGSRTWNQFAALAQTPEQRWTLEICAALETQSAEVPDAAIRRLG